MDENSTGCVADEAPSKHPNTPLSAAPSLSQHPSSPKLQSAQQLQPQPATSTDQPFTAVPPLDGHGLQQPPHIPFYQPQQRPRFNSLAEAFGVQPESVRPPPSVEGTSSNNKQPLQKTVSTGNMSAGPPPIPGSPLASPQSQLSQGFDGMAAASPFPPHMHQQFSHQSPAPMGASPGHSMPPPQSPAMSPAPNSVGYPQPPTPQQQMMQQRPTMPGGMPMTPGGSQPMGPPGTPGGAGGPMTPMTPGAPPGMQQQMQLQQQQQAAAMQQQHMMQQHQLQQQQMGMQQGGMMMQPQQQQQMMMQQGQQPYGYPQGQWPQQQMMPPQYVRKPQVMGNVPGAPAQRVMIQRVPYPNNPGYPAGTVPGPPQPQGAQYANRPMYPPGQVVPPGAPPGYGYPQGTMVAPSGQQPQQQQMQQVQQQQQPVPYGQPGGPAAPQGMQQAYVTPQYPPGAQQRPPSQQLPMRPPYMQSPGGQQMMPGQQPVFPPQSVQPGQQAPQQQPPGTPGTPYTTGGPRFPPGTPTASSPLHAAAPPQQQQGGVPGTPQQQPQQQGPDMRSPQLMSPSQAAIMQQVQQQPAMHPAARQMSNGDLHMRPHPQPVQQMQQVVQQQQQQPQLPLPPHPMMHSGAPYLARDPAVQQQLRADMTLVGCLILILDWDRYTTERGDQIRLKERVRSLGGDVEFGTKMVEQLHTRAPITHVVISHLILPTPRGAPNQTEHALFVLMKESKRIVTMQWLLDVVEGQSMRVPWRIAHLPIPMPPDQLRSNVGRIISITGYTDSERAAVKYMVESIGAKLMPGLTQHTHLLVAKNISSSEKFERAREWGVPAVSMQWLIDAYMGQPRAELEHPRYAVSSGPPAMEIDCGTFTLECMHDSYKHCLAAWRCAVPCTQPDWDKAMANKSMMENDEHLFPLKKLKLTSSPAPSEEEIKAAHEEAPPPKENGQIVVAFEGFDQEMEEMMGRKIRLLGGRVCEEVEECTHLVCIDGRRTVGLLKGLVLGRNLVHAGWVNSSYEQRRFADTFDFFLRDEESEKSHGCNFKLSVMRARAMKVYEDCEFYITPSVEPSPEIVRTLCELGGGIVHDDPPTPAKMIECIETDKPLILIATECDMSILKYLTDAGITVYSNELIFSSIMRQEVEPHPLFIVNPHACLPAPLRLPSMVAALPLPPSSSASQSAASTPSRRTSIGQTPPPTAAAAAEFASPQTPRIKAN